MVFNIGLIFIVTLVALMIINLYKGYKVLKKYEQTKDAALTKLVSRKIKRALACAFLSLILTGIWALAWIITRK